MKSNLNVLIVHSSADLYGSDRSLLDFVRMRDKKIRVVVVLPEDGPLYSALEQAGADVRVGETGKIRRDMLSVSGFLGSFRSLFSSILFLSRLHRENEFDVVYSNTLAVMGGVFFAKIFFIPHVWHVREISDESRLLTAGFRFLVRFLSDRSICNSNQTLCWINPSKRGGQYSVIWNGYDLPGNLRGRNSARRELAVEEDEVLFVFVGRLNAWKGQELLVRAIASIAALPGPPIRLTIFGSAAAGQVVFEKSLMSLIDELDLSQIVQRFPFRDDIEVAWLAADVAVVPSTSPEPFGRVAIEAMAFGCPVVASAHGGLLDIVLNDVTGILVKPDSIEDLATALQRLRTSKYLRVALGVAGCERQKKMFSIHRYAESVSQVLLNSVT